MGNVGFNKLIIAMEITEKLKQFCCLCIYDLANTYNSVFLTTRKEYEHGLNEVLNRLGVPESDRENIYVQSTIFADSASIPYHELTPLNQLIVTIPPYVFYCLRNKLPNEDSMKEEASFLLNDATFPRYLQEQGATISQEIKGALYRPGLGWLDARVVKIIESLLLAVLIGFLYVFKEHLVLQISSYVAGVVSIVLWACHLFSAKRYIKIAGSVHHFTIWQWNILPILTAICLFLTGNIIFVPLGIIFFFLPRWLMKFSFIEIANASPYIMILIYGWNIGFSIGKLLNITFPYWEIMSGISGILLIEVACGFILGFVSGDFGGSKRNDRKQCKKIEQEESERELERARMVEQAKHTYEYYDNPNDYAPNAYGYTGIESEKDIRETGIIEDQNSKDPQIEDQKSCLKGLLTEDLTRPERLIIVMYYHEEMTMKEIAAKLNLSESKVAQMHAAIIARLKAEMNDRKDELSCNDNAITTGSMIY